MNDKTKWENAHFGHDTHPVDGIMLKPAAAQEAVAWQVGDEFYTSESLAIEGIQQWGPSGAIAIPLYAAPVAAAPVEPLKVFSEGPWVFRETGQEFSGADLDEAAFAEYRRAGTPAAPGIDAASVREMLEGWKNSDYPLSYEGQCAQKALNACIADLEGLLIDASPKGGSTDPRKLPCLPFAVFDEFGVGADDRVADYGRACATAAMQATSAEVGE